MGSVRTAIRKGTEVRWRGGAESAIGKVVEIHRSRVTRTLNGSPTTRYGSADNPAYLIEQQDGSSALKLRSEVERA